MLTRREVLESALLGALALATPGSLAALIEQVVADRYLILELSDGRLLAVDTHDRRRAYLLTLRPAEDGPHRLSGTGAVIVHGGRLSRIETPALTSFYELNAEPRGTVVIQRRDRSDLPPVRIPLSRGATDRGT